MPNLPNLSGSNIQDTYQRVLHTDGTLVYNGTGSVISILPVTASYAISASHEITYELSSSYAETASMASSNFIVQGDITASGNISSSGTLIGGALQVTPTATSEDATHYVKFQKSGNSLSNFTNGLAFNPSTDTMTLGGVLSLAGQAGTITGLTSLTSTNITASGNISSSGTIKAQGAFFDLAVDIAGNHSIDYNAPNLRVKNTGLQVNGDITASGNISASGDIYGKGLTISDKLVSEEGTLLSLTGGGSEYTINGVGVFSGTAAAAGTAGTATTANGWNAANNLLLNNNVKIVGKEAGGASRNLLTISTGDIVQLAATGLPTSLRSSGIINMTGSLYGAGYDISAIQNITASGYISASGHIFGNRLYVGGTLPLVKSGTNVVSFGTNNISAGNLTASVNISSSGNIYAVDYFDNGANINTLYAPVLGSDDNYVTDAEKTVIGNTSNTNTGDETISSINALNITTVGTIGTGTWNGDVIAEAKLENQSGTNTGDNTANTTYSNVNNTSDANKPVSTAQAAAIALKSNIASPAFTGAVTASGNISSSANIYAADYYASGQKVRPNLYWFGVCDAVTLAANANLGAFPSTDVSIVSFAATTLTSDAAVFTLATDEVTITRAGVYKFTYNVLLEIGGGANRTEGAIGILRNRATDITLIDGSRSSTYNRFAAGGVSRTAGSVSMFIDVAVDDKFYIGFYKEEHQTSNTQLQTVPSGTTWTIEAVT